MAKIVLNGETRDVVTERTDAGTAVVVDGRRYVVTAVVALVDSFAFQVGDRSNTAYVSSGALSLAGRTYTRAQTAIDTDTPAASASGSGDGRVQAPMPGGIIALHVREGEHVTAGQPLVVLESMKMHNEITSPANGIVRRVNIKVGEQVSFGHVLVEVGADATE
jgi:biotin carboxyl carrier protein